MRTRVMNQLQALAMNEGYRWKRKTVQRTRPSTVGKARTSALGWSRRKELLELLDRLNPNIEELTAAAEQEARKRPDALRLMTHPGVGPLTALAYVLIIGTPNRFDRGKQIGNYVGMIPCEDSSGGKQRLGHIRKQGNSLLRFLLVEAAQAAARCLPGWRRRYIHLAIGRHKSIAKVAVGRRLLKKYLTGPTLLEMSGYDAYRSPRPPRTSSAWMEIQDNSALVRLRPDSRVRR